MKHKNLLKVVPVWVIALIATTVLAVGGYPAPSQTGPPTGDNVSSAPRTPGPGGATRLSPAEAIAAAVNDLEPIADGYRLRLPATWQPSPRPGWRSRPRAAGRPGPGA